MAWEMRGRAGPYYRRSLRESGRVVKDYFGSGPVAELAARQDAERRACRLREARAGCEARATIRRAEGQARRLDDACRLVAGAALHAAGYHQHSRTWRRKRARPELAGCRAGNPDHAEGPRDPGAAGR